jgi:carbonic anhydrase/acetyltransferase-like protein (isoleucine patch superfamily)
MPIYALDGIRPELPANGNYWMAPDAVLIGRVKIEEEASIWFGAVLRGDNELIAVGARSNIQDRCVLHTDPGFPLVIGENCTIGHGAILHGCTIGRNTLIGMNSVIMDGADIGDECIVGAMSFVRADFRAPRRSLVVGAPAKVLREVSDEEIAWKSRGTAFYQALAARSRESLLPAEPLSAVEPGRRRIDAGKFEPLYKVRQRKDTP